MAVASQSLGLAVQVAFILLAVATLADWVRHRDPQRLFLVLALVTLTILTLIGPINSVLKLPAEIYLDFSLIAFLLSGYFLLLFRDSVVPLGRAPKWVITGVVAVVAVLAIGVRLPSDPNATRTPLQLVAVGAVIITWLACVGEPAFRLGLASVGRPAVEGARLRALSLGYLLLAAVVVVATVLGPSSRNPNVQAATDVIVLIVVPMLYASFSPPGWLRRIWAYPEQAEVRRAMHDLLLYSPDRESLARKATEWAARLVGGAAAFVVDADGSILAACGVSPEAALQIAKDTANSESTITIPLDLEEGQGRMTIISGPFTPVFGQDEIGLLRGYAVSITAGLDRVSLTQRIALLEKAKTDFLNLASHELRAPMTVIKGYLTMLAGGTLGEMPAKAVPILPMLVAKSDEITALLEQMIEASRLEEGRFALKKQHTDIVELTESAIEAMQPLLADKRMVEFERPAHEVWGDVDPDRYQIVVRNLVSNAVKYSNGGSNVTVRLLPDGRTATLQVVDHGIGIAKEDQARLFTRFNRILTPDTRDIPGTGLGLYLARDLARRHGGDIEARSEAGRGSTFTLTVPLAAAA